MKTEEVSKDIYNNIVRYDNIYNAVVFNELNKYKVDDIKYLLFKDKKYRFGVCVGIINKDIMCPFSAPFGTIIPLRKLTSINYYDDAIKALDYFATENKFESVKFILPPMFYDETHLSIFVSALYRNGYRIKTIDLNYQFDMQKIQKSYFEILPHNGRKNLRIALNSDLIFKHCDTSDEKKKSYDVIAENRYTRGYPLKMTFQQVMDTIQIVKHDLFLVKKEEVDIAAALIYYINDTVVQVIYWGDCAGYGEFKPMNFLAYQLINFYSEKGIKYIDVGPSSENGIPNLGLCSFKESIGCDISNKFTMYKNI